MYFISILQLSKKSELQYNFGTIKFGVMLFDGMWKNKGLMLLMFIIIISK